MNYSLQIYMIIYRCAVQNEAENAKNALACEKGHIPLSSFLSEVRYLGHFS